MLYHFCKYGSLTVEEIENIHVFAELHKQDTIMIWRYKQDPAHDENDDHYNATLCEFRNIYYRDADEMNEYEYEERSDIIRLNFIYCCLYKCGGIYVDIRTLMEKEGTIHDDNLIATLIKLKHLKYMEHQK